VSEEIEPVEGSEPAVDSAEGATAAAAEPQIAEPTYEFLDLDETLTDKYVKLTIEGEEVPVKLSEALKGYNAAAVSTKRFQEAAELRKQAEMGLRIQQALQTDPEMTLRILAQQAGLTPAQFIAQQQQQAPAEPEFTDPLEREVYEAKRQVQQLQERMAQQDADRSLQQAISGLQQRYGVDDAVTRDVVATAYRMGVGPEAFDMIYQSMAFQRMQVEQQTAQEREAARQAQEQQRRQAAAAAAGAISTGGSAANTTTVPAGEQKMSLREAIESAFDG